MSESKLVREILLEAPKHGCRLFRNNVGVLEDVRGNKVKYGLCVGSSDLIGWITVTSARLMGLTLKQSRFVAIECKSRGKKASEEQQAFIDAVLRDGGIAGIAYSVQDFRRIIGVS